MRIRTLAAAAAIAVAAGTGGAAAASASSTPVYSTSTTVKYIYGNGKCLHTHIHGVRNYGYSSKAGRYVKLVKPSNTNSDSYKCHA